MRLITLLITLYISMGGPFMQPCFISDGLDYYPVNHQWQEPNCLFVPPITLCFKPTSLPQSELAVISLSTGDAWPAEVLCLFCSPILSGSLAAPIYCTVPKTEIGFHFLFKYWLNREFSPLYRSHFCMQATKHVVGLLSMNCDIFIRKW